VLCLLHPFMPFVTEEIYQRLPGPRKESIMIAPFPGREPSEIDEEGEAQMAMIMGVVETVRNIRGEMGFPPAARIEVQVRAREHRGLFKAYEYYVKELARISEIAYLSEGTPGKAALGIFKDVEVFVPIRDMEVIRRERSRVDKELARLGAEADRVFNKINNRAFREKAPEAVLQKEEASFEELRGKQGKLLASKEMLEGLLRD